MFIQWTDTYKLGIPSVDTDHKLLVDLLNRFFAQAQDGGATAELGETLSELVGQTKAHFSREEVLLDRGDYPHLAQHIAEHKRLLQQMGHFLTPYQAGSASRELTIETAEFLRHWLLDHIMQEDMPYRPYLKTLS
jgi:hemerythrin-like metal-binding protein